MEHSSQLDQLATALAMVQAELVHGAGPENPFIEPGPNELSAVLRTVTPALNRYGLAVVQGFEPAPERQLMLTTMVMHRSGQWLRSTALLPLAEETPRAFGPAVMRARRLGLLAVCGLATGEGELEEG